ncbi:MAG: UdgX family uracil-DNA binding protein, partial [Rubrivivax sp.]
MNAELANQTDVDGFRRLARQALASRVRPESLHWAVAGEAAPQLFAAANVALADEAGSEHGDTPSVPAEFIDLCREVVLHRDPQRFARLYQLLWRLQHQPHLRRDPLDADWIALRHMAQAVRRDLHKMKAFVRFRPIDRGPDEATLHVAWFEPEHHIVEAVSPFFVRRFANMAWAILTPLRSVYWDGGNLTFGPGAHRQQAPPPDAGEALWLTYYRSIFNPARLKLRAMQKEMPRRYWANLPEAQLISTLSAHAAQRSGEMIERPATRARATAQPRDEAVRMPAPQRAMGQGSADAQDGVETRGSLWLAQRDAASNCRACPLGALATQTVWGEGPIGARLMLVGEQPGDQEDLQGRPFVGPSGQLLQRAMTQLNWPRDRLYVTNSVKHFKYEPRGKRRMHKTPAQREADACEHWLESEISLVRPTALVALGATAARQLLGRPVAVTRERGRWLRRADGLPVLITLHPSALLRNDSSERELAYAAWLDDLAQASEQAQA